MPSVGVVRHGGRLREAAALFRHAPAPWLDLSTGINPWPWTGERAPFSDLNRLPDPADIQDLEVIAAAAFGVDDPGSVVAMAGAEAALRLLPAAIDAGDVAVVSPTYASHADSWSLAGRQVRNVSFEGALQTSASVVVLVNPNNPDGRRIERDVVSRLAEQRSQRGLWTVIDESFVEVTPDLSVAKLAVERLIVVRSFGKFYGLPGVRLGFGLARPAVADRLRALQGDWPISADALHLGRAAYQDAQWRDHTRIRLEDAAKTLDVLLSAHGLNVIGGVSLFRLVSTPEAQRLFQGLCERGILVRSFSDAPDRLRIGLADAHGFERLSTALKDLRS